MGGTKSANEAFFARMGAENAQRPDNLPPSQGGKYAGFGSDGPLAAGNTGSAGPNMDEWQKETVAALSKGFGWFSGMVGKGAGAVGEGLQKV